MDGEYIKVNLPESEEDYLIGTGEGCWAIADKAAKRAYDEDADSGEYSVTLDNDSICWEGLIHGTVVPIEMRGDKRPVVPYNWLFARFGKC